jgi:hypothetical protein
MTTIYINPLSANEQCHTVSALVEVVCALVGGFKYILPGIDANRINLLYDSRLEQRFLEPKINFKASIAKLSIDEVVGRDIKLQWYLYTKNHAGAATLESCNVEISSDPPEQRVNGEISTDGLDRASFWMSFGGSKINCQSVLKVISGDNSSIKSNSHDLGSLQQLLPIYQPNPTKHRKEAYFDVVRKEHVAPMPLDDREAQNVLLTSILYDNSRWAYCRDLAIYYCFKLTHPEQNVYHGYQVAFEDLPVEVGRLLREGL